MQVYLKLTPMSRTFIKSAEHLKDDFCTAHESSFLVPIDIYKWYNPFIDKLFISEKE